MKRNEMKRNETKRTHARLLTAPHVLASNMSLSKPCRSKPSEYDTSSASDEEMNQLFQEVRRKRVRRRLVTSYYHARDSSPPTPSSWITNVTEDVTVSV